MADALSKNGQQAGQNSEVVYFAKTNFRGQDKIFGIKRKDRRQHVYIIGQTGTGKTVLLRNLALQDIKNGRGLCIIDPHGEFVESVLASVPKERADDVIYFNPVDVEYPVGFNILEVPDPEYKHLVASGLMGIFMKIWPDVWSARMEYILNNCVLALLDTPGTTLLGIPRIMVDKDYRQKIIANVKDPIVRSFWIHEYETWRDQFRNEAIVPIQNKVGQFLNTSLIRNVVGQEKSTINITEIMDKKKILLVNVSKGRVGEDNSGLLGGMIITKIQLEAMERVRIPEEQRQDFYLYVDEFQNFATDSFANILSEARKYRLNLTIAHQYIGQLVTDVSTKVRDAVFGNVGTKIIFRVGASDAEFLEQEMSPEFMLNDLVNLPNYNIYLRLMVDNVPSRPFSADTLAPMDFEANEERKAKIIENSRRLYSKPRKEVETRISRWSGMETEEEARAGEARRSVAYQANCQACGRKIRLSFKPDESRPVYCGDCLRKIRQGEMAPLPFKRPGPAREKEKYEMNLGELGIEFAPPARQTRPSGQGGISKDDLVRKIPAKQILSLADLKSRADRNLRPRPKAAPHLKELKDVLARTLGELGLKKNKSGNSLKSGEAVKFNRGFTLIELLVSVSIITIITMLAFINYPGFSKKITIERAAQELVLNLRKAQTYALGVKEDNLAGQFYFPIRYGVVLPKGEANNQYRLFAYQSLNVIDYLSLPGATRISEICIWISDNWTCKSENIPPLTISFSRPDPSMGIYLADTGYGTAAKIVVSLPDSDFSKTIYILSTGSIYVE
ncbi:MAG: hypothetical protein UV43_C0059G0006 [Parcubacteria group bacterium GW2011_GWF2_42_7]|nr:MAG: hypothetical protein UU96_C0013G0004 [Parcubacteria group bacterium GW2011_GWC2_42_13]KKS70546.1 MAG: hypothetical protein UV43_C0059G0006 [Parcubacteria group bacterium GW2011_GWF2_42_7]